jgi:hypothetical protein
MILKLERDYLAAQIAGMTQLLHTLAPNDYLGRLGLESRRTALEAQLTALGEVEEKRAHVALYFGGEPVIGSMGVQAEFGTRVLGSFQDLVTKVWGSLDGNEIQQMGPIRDKDASQLHITSVVHGSFGFVLEELEGAETEHLFESPLSQAAEQVAMYISTFAGEDDASFSEMIEALNPRVFQTIRTFFEQLHKDNATFRMVEGARDEQFNRTAIERAWQRAEASDVLEDRIPVLGVLLGVLPMKRRFELESKETGSVIEGKVGERFTKTYLEHLDSEKYTGKLWRALLHKRTVRKAGREPVDSYTLLELEELTE